MFAGLQTIRRTGVTTSQESVRINGLDHNSQIVTHSFRLRHHSATPAWRSLQECGTERRSLKECGTEKRSLKECGTKKRSLQECGTERRGLKECGTERRSLKECGTERRSLKECGTL